jgi:hypothetical protein
MTKTTVKQPTLKSLEKDCSSIRLEEYDQALLVTSSLPVAVLSTAILSRIMINSEKRFHTTFSEPVITVDTLNDLRQKYKSSVVILVGIDIIGTGRVKKASGYPIIVGGEFESEQIESFRLGTNQTLTSVAYVLTESLEKQFDYDLQLATAGALLSIGSEKTKKNANNEVIELAKSKGIIEERKGFKLLGVSLLPLDEVFRYSTYPYLQSISGNQKACDSLLNEAEIPVAKLRTPLSNLSTSEAQRLTSKLIPTLDSNVISRLLGPDYEFPREPESSLFRHLSGIEIVASTAWALNEPGAFMSVLFGDRGRALRLLIDSHMSHHKDVISAVQRLESNLMSESTTSATIIKASGYRVELLPDIGRIALETGIVDTGRPVALNHDDAFIIVWPSHNLALKDAFRSILKEKIDQTATSIRSIKIFGGSQERERALQIIATMNKESG